MRVLISVTLNVSNFYNQLLSSDTAKKIFYRDKPYFAKGDVRGVLGSEKHVMNFCVFIWRKAVSPYM
jgi:hypothetical protein